MLKGDKVAFRPLKRSDIAYFLKWYNDMEVTQYVDGYLPSMEMNEEKGIEELAAKIRAGTDVFFIIEALDDDNKTIGHIQLVQINPKDHKAGFGIFIGEKSHWGKGYGTEAVSLFVSLLFDSCDLNLIRTATWTGNKRMVRCAQRAGFTNQKIMPHRSSISVRGEPLERIEFSLSSAEWYITNRDGG